MSVIRNARVERAHEMGLHQDNPVEGCGACVAAEELAYARNLGFSTYADYQHYIKIKFRKRGT